MIKRPLAHHGRYPYRPITDPAPFRWPEGRGLAIMVALNLEIYAFGEGIVDELVSAGPGLDVINYPWLDYGNRVGAHRLRACSPRSDCRSRCSSTATSTAPVPA